MLYRTNFCCILLNHKSILDDKKLLDNEYLIVWFCLNIGIIHDKLIPIPIGIASSRWPHGDIDVMQSVTKNIKPFLDRKLLIYVNFAYSRQETRQPAYNVRFVLYH